MKIMLPDSTHKISTARRLALKLSNVLIGVFGNDNDFALLNLVH